MIETDSQFKVVLVGGAKVGKSCLMTRYLAGSYSNCYVRTLGADFKIKCVDTEAPRYKLQVWDTGGGSSVDGNSDVAIRNTQAVLICYDVTNRASFQEVPKWIQQVQLHSAVDCIISLVGCKSDSYVSRKVSREEGEKLAGENNCHFEECSAKKNTNVGKIFKDVATLMKKQLLEINFVDIEEEGKEATLLVRRSTITDANCKVQQGAYPILISGACSWVNSGKINGRYVPRITKLRPSDAVEEFCFVNVDSPNTVMVYKDNHWLIKRNRKEMASVYSPSIQCFPDEASSRNQWNESGGVYFTWMRLQPHIQCTALSPAAALALSAEKGLDLSYGPNKPLTGGSSHGFKGLVRSSSFSISREERVSFTNPQNNINNAGGLRRTVSHMGTESTSHSGKMSNSSCHGLSVLTVECGRGSAGLADAIFVSAGRCMGGTLDMNAFLECIQQPEVHLGLSLVLFTQFIRLRLALLEFEYRNNNDKNSGWESGALVQICAQTLRIHETCADYLRKANHGDAGPIEPSVDAILLAGKAFLRQLSKHLALLCSVEKGAFEQARQCRDVKVQVEGYLNDLCPEYTSRASFSYSLSSRASFSSPAGGSPRSPLSPM